MSYLSLNDLIPYYTIRHSTVTKELIFEVSRYYTESKSSTENSGNDWRPWDCIAPGLYLGKLPALGNSIYSYANQHEQIIEFIAKKEGNQRPLGMVVSVVDYFELAGRSVVSPADWQQKGVKHFMLPISDFTADVPNETVIAAVLEIRKCIAEGKSVYIHCKAGRSRSAMICAIYLALYGNEEDLLPCKEASMQEVKFVAGYLKQRRPQVDLDQEKLEKALEIFAIIKNQEEERSELKSPIITLKDILCSLKLKNAIIHFNSFKKLAVYACWNQSYFGSSKLTNYTQEFFNSILKAQDDAWYRELISGRGPMQNFVSANSYNFYFWDDKNDKETRRSLRSEFIHELYAYLTQEMRCSVKDIKNAILELGARVNP